MKIEMPTAAENPAIADAQFEQKLRDILVKVRAQKAYFTTLEGRRTDYIVVNVEDASQMSAVAEPFFLWLGVKAEFFPEMSPGELAASQPIRPQG